MTIDRAIQRARDKPPKTQQTALENTKDNPEKASVLRAQLFIRPHTGAIAPTHMKDREL